MADATIASTCNHLNGHLICVQAPVVGEINIFSTYFVPLSVWKLKLSVVFLTYKNINKKTWNILSTLLTQPNIVFFLVTESGITNIR